MNFMHHVEAPVLNETYRLHTKKYNVKIVEYVQMNFILILQLLSPERFLKMRCVQKRADPQLPECALEKEAREETRPKKPY